jgi:hypothetical protein
MFRDYYLKGEMMSLNTKNRVKFYILKYLSTLAGAGFCFARTSLFERKGFRNQKTYFAYQKQNPKESRLRAFFFLFKARLLLF